jgi:hypothetical protein
MSIMQHFGWRAIHRRNPNGAAPVRVLLATAVTGILLAQVPGTPSEVVLYVFKGWTHGARPMAGVVRDSAGNLYGTNSQGGTGSCLGSGCGVVG